MPRDTKSAGTGEGYLPSITAADKEEISFLRQKFSSLVMRGHYRECFKLIEDNLGLLYFKERWPENFHASLQLHKRCYSAMDNDTPYEDYLRGVLRKHKIPGAFAALVKGNGSGIDWSVEFFRDLAMVSEHKGDTQTALDYADIAIKQDPLNSNCFLLKGWILQNMDLDDEAAEMFRHALELNKNNYQASSGLAELLTKSDPQAALDYIQSAIDQAPGEAGFHAGKAKILLRLGERKKAMAAWDDAIARDPLNPSYSYEKAELLMADGQTIAAVRQYGKAVGADPSHTPSLVRLANLLEDTQPEMALSYINTVTTQQPEDREALLLKARLLERTGENLAATRAWRQLLEKDPASARANAALGRLYLPETPHRALPYFERAMELEPREAEHVVGKASALERTDELESAVKCYRTALTLNRELPTAWAALGDIYRERDPKEALACYTKAAQYAPDRADYHLRRGDLLLSLSGDNAAALECFLAAERTDPGNADLQVRIGQLLEKAGNNTSALDRYRKAVSLAPDLAPAYFGLARIVRGTDPGMALLYINSAIDLDANQGDYYYLKYQILLELGRKKDALGSLMRTLTEKNATPDTLQEAGLLLGEDSPRVALLYINRAIEMLPDSAEYLCARAELLDAMGERAKAMGQFAKAAEMDPTLHRAEFGWGRILAARGKEEALEHLDRAVELDPSNPEYHAERARLLARRHDRYRDALASFDAAIALDNQRWEDMLEKAQLLEAHADIPEAVEHYRRVLLINQDCLEANAKLGMLLADRNPGAALVYLGRAMELDPQSYLYHIWCGRILYARGDHGQAEGEYMQALELGGETDEVYFTLAKVLCEKLPETGLKYCRLAIEKKPDEASYHLLQGKIHLLLGEAEAAAEAFARALEQDSRCHEALAQMALLQFRRQDESCLETIDRALKIDRNNPEYLHQKARMLCELREDLPGAIEALRRSLHAQPASLECRELLVELLGKNRNPVKRLLEKRKLDRYRQRAAAAERKLLEDKGELAQATRPQAGQAAPPPEAGAEQPLTEGQGEPENPAAPQEGAGAPVVPVEASRE